MFFQSPSVRKVSRDGLVFFCLVAWLLAWQFLFICRRAGIGQAPSAPVQTLDLLKYCTQIQNAVLGKMFDSAWMFAGTNPHEKPLTLQESFAKAIP
jgi:hypothetical protein